MNRMAPQPDALAIGPMKCGTSWLHAYLTARQDVCLPMHVKETFFFDKYYERGLDWYRAFFAHFDPGRHCLVTEVAPTLFHSSETVPQRVRDALGDVPLVVVLRHPVDRSWSHYNHMRRSFTQKSLKAAVLDHPEILAASRYSVHLPRWKSAFSRLSVLAQDELDGNREAFVSNIDRSLGLKSPRPEVRDLAPVNTATTTRFFFLSYAARKTKQALRSAGLFSVVSALKGPALTRILYKGDADNRIGDDDRAFLEAALSEEIGSWRSLLQPPSS